ncbi:MAG: hypothetical protein N2Z76_03985 [Treponemataceae bacterium]|nr:hypothetical protein [Treponemataceae bacterium]
MIKTLKQAVIFLVVLGNLFFWLRTTPGEPLYSPTWGFRIDPPEGFEFVEGDGKNQFSFVFFSSDIHLDIRVYPSGHYKDIETLGKDVQKRLKNQGDQTLFEYRGKQALLMRLDFPFNHTIYTGWAVAFEVYSPLTTEGHNVPPSFLIALIYGPGEAENSFTSALYVSTLDSLAPTSSDQWAPGPITFFTYPPGTRIQRLITPLNLQVSFDTRDEEASASVVEREYRLLTNYLTSSRWKEAWIRFYRMIYKDAYERLRPVAIALEAELGEAGSSTAQAQRQFAEKLLAWLQQFSYERDPTGTDLVNPVTAALEGRGDCDSRALVWAITLNHVHIPAAMMVSREYRHAMGLVLLDGAGARFTLGSRQWVVAETTASVPLGLIGQSVADPNRWIGILFE